MEKKIITEFGRVVNINDVEKFFRKTLEMTMMPDEKEHEFAPFGVFAVLSHGEIVNIGSFADYDIAEIIEVLLDVFSTDEKEIFDVNAEEDGVKGFLESLRYVTGNLYPTAVHVLKIKIANGDFDVSFTK